MGFMDEAKELAEKAKDLAGEHADQVKDGVSKAADFVDEKTGNKFSGAIDKGEEFVSEHLKKDEPAS